MVLDAVSDVLLGIITVFLAAILSLVAFVLRELYGKWSVVQSLKTELVSIHNCITRVEKNTEKHINYVYDLIRKLHPDRVI